MIATIASLGFLVFFSVYMDGLMKTKVEEENDTDDHGEGCDCGNH